MRLKSFAITDIGMKRKINQDAYLCDDSAGLFLVADGMGGHLGGEVASQLAVKVIKEFCDKSTDVAPKERIDKAINLSSEEIFKKAGESPELTGMGTTILAMLVQNEEVFIGQVGDSRAYLIQNDAIWQITEDHSLLNEEIRAGRIAVEEASNYQFKNVITRSVGYESKVVVDVYKRKAKAGDTFLLCSDGLSGLVENTEIADYIHKFGLEEGLKGLISLANSRGGDDNITVLVCRVED